VGVGSLLVRAAGRQRSGSAKGFTFSQTTAGRSIEVFRSYAYVLERAAMVLAGLRGHGMTPGVPVVVMLDSIEAFVTTFWACALGGAPVVPIMVSHGRGGAGARKRLRAALSNVGPSVVVINSEDPGRVVEEAGTDVTVATIQQLARTEAEDIWWSGDADSPALLIETSGSTGTPRYVVLTHRNIMSNVAASIQTNAIGPDCTELNTFPLDHIGPLIRCMVRPLWSGQNQVHLDPRIVLACPENWLTAACRHRATHVWAPCFFFRMLHERLGKTSIDIDMDLSHIRSVLAVAEPVDGNLMEALTTRLGRSGLSPKAMHCAWGMTETASAVLYSHDYLDRRAGTVANAPVEAGLPVPDCEVRVVDEAGSEVVGGVEGHLQVRGPMITPGYYNDPSQTATAFTKDGWLRTGDLAVRHCDRVTITGRESDRLMVRGRVVGRRVIEAAIDSVRGVREGYSVVFEEQAGADSALSAAFVPDKHEVALETVLVDIRRSVLLDTGVSLQRLVPVRRSQLPRSNLGKLLRREVAEMCYPRVSLMADQPQGVPLNGAQSAHRRADDHVACVKWMQVAVTEMKPVEDRAGSYVVLLGPDGQGLAVLAALADCGYRCAAICDEGASFGTVAPVYRTVAERSQSYIEAFSSVRRDVGPVAGVLDMRAWRASEPVSAAELHKAATRSLWGLRSLVYGLRETRSFGDRTKLLVVTTGATDIAGGLCGPSWAVGTYALSAALESSWLDVRHVDVPLAEADSSIRAVIGELWQSGREPRLALVSGRRYVPTLEPVTQEGTVPARLRMGGEGAYVLTGGLGAVGFEVARHIGRRGGRVLIVGRTPLYGNDHSTVGHDDSRAAKEQRMAELRSLPGDVTYCQADACCPEELESVVAQAERSWKRQATCIMHLCRSSSPQDVLEHGSQSLATTLAPKTLGTAAVARLLPRRPNTFAVAFSSATSLYGSYRMGAYAAACSLQHSYCQILRQTLNVDIRCWLWGIWDCGDGARDYQMRDLAKARGFRAMLPETAIAYMRLASGLNQKDVYIGLRPTPRRGSENAPSSPGDGAFLLRADETPDTLVSTQAIPIRDGIVDTTVREVIGAVLKVGAFDIDDSFLDLGGDSLSVLQAVHALETSLQCEVMPDELLFQSVRQLVRTLEDRLASSE
jgi:acyl-CoA synthetase (AMP-forming)/AMP-acid ligase II/acyl carrier protein